MQTARLYRRVILYVSNSYIPECIRFHSQLMHRTFDSNLKTCSRNLPLINSMAQRHFTRRSEHSNGTYDPKNDPEVKDLMKEIMGDFDHSNISEEQFNSQVKDGGCTETNIDAHDKASSINGLDNDVEEENCNDTTDNSSEDEDELYEDAEVEYERVYEKHSPVPLKRGETGVYDIEDLVVVLRSENAHDICVIKVPAECHYVDYMVIVSGSSARHIRAMAEWVIWVYKRKRSPKDQHVMMAGKNSKSWVALDMGNIVLHIMSDEAREYYDLETLWTVGSNFDEKCIKEADPYIVTIEKP
ncbi:uncharacterized protein LOC106156776 [Lingula anatina]|uniref:Mitochondrial assembly of ribosomal large subunit protein 1 n=1 Tax=Lingula anatina TaxID=7574 RepID=A0A1S3HNM0_LINAN|nr:uncharacterized protein LOC106156776 [Lingula anatina]|eukprot:XP_013387653.1 uncharacterized protein LOC106156776 [Lingula anatina]